jgi:3-deoxy-D-manno-octulosonic-acid transferase
LNLVYAAAIVLAMPWLVVRAICQGKYRQGFAEKLLGLVPRRRSAKKCVWLHAVSVGEVNLLATLIDRFARERPDCQCVVSTTTMTGMALAKKKYPHQTVFYCPLDFSWAVRAAIRRIHPDVLVLAELELWPNLIWAARRFGAKVAVVNGRLSEHSARGYGRIRPLVARLLGKIDVLAVQDAEYAARFRRLGAPQSSITVTGSMKYDGAETDRQNPATQALRRLAGFQDQDVVFLAGSTQEPEEALALDAYRQLRERWPHLRLILVPRHPDRFSAVARLLDQSGLAWRRRTELAGPDVVPAVRDLSSDARILLVDVVGELGSWWGTAQIGFVGGSMGDRGGQNMIEPAAFGAAVSFGPNTRNFRDIVETMLSKEAAVVVHSGDDLRRFVVRCLEDPDYRAVLGGRAQRLVADQLGATQATFLLLEGLIDRAVRPESDEPLAA